jgi:hypothetical protein
LITVQYVSTARRLAGWLHLPFFDWQTRPSWLFRLAQGLHVGLILFPLLVAAMFVAGATVYAVRFATARGHGRQADTRR